MFMFLIEYLHYYITNRVLIKDMSNTWYYIRIIGLLMTVMIGMMATMSELWRIELPQASLGSQETDIYSNALCWFCFQMCMSMYE